MSSNSLSSNPNSSDYSTYSVPELLKRWERNELSAEQVVGYMLQHLLKLAQGMAELERRVRQLEAGR